jgi:hypothetical protein
MQQRNCRFAPTWSNDDDVARLYAPCSALALNWVWSYGQRKTPRNGRTTLEHLTAIPYKVEFSRAPGRLINWNDGHAARNG